MDPTNGNRRLWADGTSWKQVIGPLQNRGVATVIPLTSLSDDVQALDRALERTSR